MYVTALRASGYRNLDGLYRICHPLAVIVGENNAGKSNVIDGIRTVLEAEAGPRARSWLSIDDFHHAGDGTREVDELELEVQLSDLTDRERGRMVTCLAPSLGPSCARIRLQAILGADGRILTQYIGGDSDVADVERHARDAVRFTYLPPRPMPSQTCGRAATTAWLDCSTPYFLTEKMIARRWWQRSRG